MNELIQPDDSPVDILKPLLTGQLSANTLRAYQKDLEQFFCVRDLACLTTEIIGKITMQDVIDYRNKLSQRYQPATVARKLSTLRTAFAFFVDVGLIAKNPAKNSWVKSPKTPTESRTNGLSQKEAETLLTRPDRNNLIGKRDYAILQLMLGCGLRRSEISNARVSNLKMDGSYFVLNILGKGSKWRIAKLKPQVWDAIHEYLKARGEDPNSDGHIFISHSQGKCVWQKQHNRLSGEAIRQMLKKYAKQAEIKKRIFPHSLRHTFTTLAIEGGAKIQQVQAALGHSDPKTTMRYFRSNDLLANNAVDFIHLP